MWCSGRRTRFIAGGDKWRNELISRCSIGVEVTTARPVNACLLFSEAFAAGTYLTPSTGCDNKSGGQIPVNGHPFSAKPMCTTSNARHHASLLFGSKLKAGDGTVSPTPKSGELLSLPWDPRLPLSAWTRGRASVVKLEVSRGPGRPVEWTGFVPTAGLVHSPRSVFERAVRLTGRVGSEPPTSARTVASAEAGNERRGVSLEVAMSFNPHFFQDDGVRRRQPGADATRAAASLDLTQSPFHPDLRRIACEAGELVVHCLRARNLRLRPQENTGPRDVQPEVFLTTLPDGGEAATSTSCMGPGGRHPVWGQVRVTENKRSSARVPKRDLPQEI